ncbi:membrane protein CcdC involved in cytochrome C biogenesis [Alkalibacillus filiformis]|uniref:Membrane protein CcdC involved in cytochrome C biogenesis n=1 Tax=Alkalibacillus filiformis TaxID=200990 RepID=A0ABU0DQT0_9BACI|nr:cytochrome c biogenesis protein CcdC [Alkalibacillus filiformis]MDQ0350720.1 membrane protein CcdC involved in cytochrome C biogenesis [Alkalibacillus filiformis]
MFSILDHPVVAGLITVMAVIMATGMIVVRMRASKKPATVKKIILPPLFMSTGALMFFVPYFQIQWILVVEATIVGLLFSILLIYTSNFEVKENDIYLKPSKALGFILVGLLLIRLTWKAITGADISVGETSAMFYILAFAMLLTWRVAMLLKYLKLKESLN